MEGLFLIQCFEHIYHEQPVCEWKPEINTFCLRILASVDLFGVRYQI